MKNANNKHAKKRNVRFAKLAQDTLCSTHLTSRTFSKFQLWQIFEMGVFSYVFIIYVPKDPKFGGWKRDCWKVAAWRPASASPVPRSPSGALDFFSFIFFEKRTVLATTMTTKSMVMMMMMMIIIMMMMMMNSTLANILSDINCQLCFGHSVSSFEASIWVPVHRGSRCFVRRNTPWNCGRAQSRTRSSPGHFPNQAAK